MDETHVLRALHDDHVVCERLLEALEHLSSAVGRGDAQALEVVRAIVARERGYGASVHYAREELMFERMTARAPEGADAVKGLSREHDELVRMGLTLLESLDARLAGKPEELGRLRRLVDEYVEALRNHMGKERQRVFPLSEQILHAEDWAVIAAAFPDRQGSLEPPASAAIEDVARWLEIRCGLP